jgi:tyrosine-protein kinase Etk/Wzc
MEKSTKVHLPHSSADDSNLELKTYLNILLDNRWLIIVLTCAMGMAALLFSLNSRPVYESNMMIHVEEASPTVTKNILSDTSSIFETKKTALAEIELLRSRLVLAPAVEKLHLDIEAQPRYFPLIGAWMAQRAAKRLSQPGLLGNGPYVWGGENIAVSIFKLSGDMDQGDYFITALGNRRFKVGNELSHFQADGEVGRTLQFGTTRGKIELLVDRLEAGPGAQFTVKQLSKSRVIEQLQSIMSVTEEGKQSGIIIVKLQGSDPELISKTLNEIGLQYISQDFSRKTEEAQKALLFLNAQLPALKTQLESSEAEYSQFRTRHGTVDLTEEGRIGLQRSAAAKTRRMELMQRRAELSSRVSEKHPVLIAVSEQLKQVDDEIRSEAYQSETLPFLEQEEVRLAREVKANTDLYTSLSNTAEQLRILSASKASNVHLVDAAVAPDIPLKPNRPMIIATGLMAGLFSGVILACLKKAILGRMDDPKKMEQILGARVVRASIPHTGALKRERGKDGTRQLLAIRSPDDPAIEALRGFRTSLRFAMPGFKNNIVMLGGPTSQVGKSFIAANLAAVVAGSGKRVLLIDADIRNGNLHRYFGARQRGGLSAALSGPPLDAGKVDGVISNNVIDNLDFIAAGELPAGQSDCFMRANFAALLDALKPRYDLILIDTPPLLDLSDALIIGEYVGAIFIVVRARLSRQGDLNETIKRLAQTGLSAEGILFNDVRARLGGYTRSPRLITHLA